MADYTISVVDTPPFAINRADPTPVEITVGGYGPAGPAGPQGPAGSGAFEYVQASAASNWTVVHGLGRRPGGVAVYDTLDNAVDTGVRVVDSNTIEITMAAPMAGRVVVE